MNAQTNLFGYVEEEHLRRHVPVVTGYARTQGYQEFPGLQWAVLVRMDRSDILVPIREVLWNVGAAGVVVGAPMVGLLLWATGRVRKEYLQAQQESAHAKTAEEAARKSEAIIHMLVDTALDAVVTMDATGIVTDWNVQAEPMFGWAREEAIGQKLSSLIISPVHRETFESGLQKFLITGERTMLDKQIEMTGLHRGGREVPIELTVSAIPFGDSYIFSMFVRDITDRKQAEDRLRELTQRDTLTGLFNRRYLEETLVRELAHAKRNASPLGVIMVDIDHFKQINDTYGHAGGDEVLRLLGQFLQKRTRRGDIACRYGGEEFTLILPGAPLDVVRQRAEAFRQGVAGLTGRSGDCQLPSFTLSLGVAAFPEHGDTVENLLHVADVALYRAKAEGRDRVVVADVAVSL